MVATTALDPEPQNAQEQVTLLAAPSGEAEPGRLRLILGVGRSGTTWVSRVLSRTGRPMRLLIEPLFHLEPRLPFHVNGDHTAVGYQPFSPDDPLLRAYSSLTQRNLSGPVKGLERDDAGWQLCLVKEVHALMGTEGLLLAWQTPTLFLLRDPVYVVDSLFSAQTPQTIYLDHEVEAVLREEFLNRFLPDRQDKVRQLVFDAETRQPRQRLILSKVLCTQLLQEMFLALSREFPPAKAFRYEQFCDAPHETFQAAAQALGIPWDKAMGAYLCQTMRADASSDDPYSIMRNTAGQKTRSLKFLSPGEIALCRAALEALSA